MDRRHPTRTLLSLTAALAIGATGCAEDPAEEAAPSPTADATPSDAATPAEPSGSPTGADGADGADGEGTTPEGEERRDPAAALVDAPDLDTQCEVATPELPEVEQVVYTVPSAWQVDGSCEFLDPDLETLPDQSSVDAAVHVDVSPSTYGDVLDHTPAARDTVTWLGARSNLQSARRTGVSTGEGLRPAGTPFTAWYVDLDPGTDDHGGVLTMTATSDDEETYRVAQSVVDRIAGQTAVRPPADAAATDPDRTSFAVLRTEGGGTPLAVTYDGDCFTLHPGGPTDEPTEQACDLDPTAGEIVTTTLGDTVVGYAPALAIAVEAPGQAPPYALTSSIEGGSVFALRVDEQPDELRATSFGGIEVATVTLR